MLREQLPIDPRLVVVPLEVRRTDELDEVPVADVVAREQDQVVGIAVGAALTIRP